MSEQEQEVKMRAATIALRTAVQEMADITGEHIELALGMFGVVYYKFYHPASCPEVQPKQLEADNPTDVPDVFKRLFDEPKGDS